MLRWLILIVLSSWFFFMVPPPGPRPGAPGFKPHPLAKEILGLRLARALTIGDQGIMAKRELAPYRKLGLLHLFTPSGMQLSALNSIIPKSGRFAVFKFVLFFSMLTIYLSPHDYFAIKRMALWNVLREGRIFSALFRLNYWPSAEFTFVAAFLIDFFWGTWIQSPLSFCYSFLFAGCFLLLGNTPRFLWPLGLFMAYGILGEFRGEQLNALVIPASLLLTYLFNPIVLYCLLGVVLHLIFKSSIILYPLHYLHQMIESIASLTGYFPILKPNLCWSFFALILFELFLFRPIKSRKKIFLIVLLLLMPIQILNFPPQSRRPLKTYELRPVNRSDFKWISQAKLHSHVILATGEHCQLLFTSTLIYLHQCRYKKSRIRKKS